MPDDNTSGEYLDGGNQPTSQENASVGDGEMFNLSEINTLLGRNYSSKDVALKSIKETYSYTGKVGQLQKQVEALSSGSQQPQASNELESTVKALQVQLEESTFFAERPELKEYATTLREARATSGKSLADIASSEAYKSLFEKALAQDAVQKKRAVLDPTNRLGTVKNKMSDAREALKSGNVDGARSGAVESVLEAYNL